MKNRPVDKASNFLYRIAHSDLFAFNLRSRDRWVAEQAGQITRGKRVIDVGAGSAPYRALFSHCEYKTQDFAALRPDQLRGGGYAQIDYVCDAKTIPVADASFDVVLCTEVLEHHPEPAAVICEFARILSMGGILLLTAPLGSGIHQEPNHYYGGYTPYWYRRFLPRPDFPKSRSSLTQVLFVTMHKRNFHPFHADDRPIPLEASISGQPCLEPFWLLLAPLLMGLIPLAAKLLDRFDDEKRFTVGYHVRAVRRDEQVES